VSVIYSYPSSDTDDDGHSLPQEETVTLKPHASHVFDQARAPGNAPPVFSATVLASGPVVATAFQESSTSLLEYSAFADESASEKLAAPLVAANNFNNFTGIQVQNTAESSTNVTVTYGPNTATKISPEAKRLCAPLPTARTKTVAPRSSATFLQQAGDKAEFDSQFSECTYVGSATISSSNGERLVAVVNQVNVSGGGSAYEAFPVPELQGVLDLPLVQANNFGSVSGIQVQNAGTTRAVGSIRFGENSAREQTGRPVPCKGANAKPVDIPVDLAPGVSMTVLVPGNTPEIKDCTYIGSAKVTAGGSAKLVALVNQVNAGTIDGLATYSIG
jgi:hypothetical protein